MQNRHTLRTFYILVLTQTFSLVGSKMSGLAVGIKVFNDTNQATPLAFAAFFGALPALVSASLAGVLADRWDRRHVMILSDVGEAAGTVLLLLSLVTGVFEVWHLYVITLLKSIFAIFQKPAFQASVTMMVPDAHRDRANAIQQLIGPMSGIVAPVFAGLAFAAVGVIGVIVIDLATFGVAMLVVWAVHIPRPPVSAEGRAMRGSIWSEMLVGLRFLASRRVLLLMGVHVALMNFLIAGALVLNTPYILTITGSEALLGTLLGFMSGGAITGAVIMSMWGGTRPRIHTIMPGIILTGVCMMFYGVSRQPVTMALALFGLMLPLPMINASLISIMQVKTPPDLQGRLFGTLDQAAKILNPLAFALAGPLADKVYEPAVGRSVWDPIAPLLGTEPGAGMGLMLLMNGLAIVVASAVAYGLPSLRRIETTLPDYDSATETPVILPDVVPSLESEAAS